MRLVIAIAAVTACFAATEPRVSIATLTAAEHSIQERLGGHTGEPMDVLENARGTYLEGYGVVFTAYLDLINTGMLNPNPFRPKVTKEDIAMTHDRKLKNLAVLRDDMRTLMLGASSTLEGLRLDERISMEAILFNFSWEDTHGLPHRLFMSAEKQKLLDAKKTGHTTPAELASIIEEQER